MIGVQTFVRRRHRGLLILVGVVFLVLLAALISYQHFQGLRLIGTVATALGAAAAFLGQRASGRLRRVLAGVFLALALAGLLGVWEHNQGRLGGGGQRPPAAQVGLDTPPFAPLSIVVFSLLGAAALIGRRDDEPPK